MSSISLPGFETLDTLRQTSKTITVKAVQRSLERTVEITLLRPELAQNQHEVQRFLSVGRICAQIKADGLPQIYDITRHDAQPYIVMEHVEGLSIAEIVRQNGPLPIALSLRVALTIADALQHAWKQSRLIHRNLKPSEIRIDDGGMPKLTGFGRATVILPDGQLTDEDEPGVIMGTPNFLSPEQIQGSTRIDCRADLYALGATLYYMITGRVPFPDSDPEAVIQMQLAEQIPHPRTFRPDLNASTSGVIARLMMKNPDDRYADWNEAMGDMQLALKNQPLGRRSTPPQGISTIASVVVQAETPPPPELPQFRKVDPRATVSIPRLTTLRLPPTDTRKPAPAVRLRSRAKTASTPQPAAAQKSRVLPLVRAFLWLLLVAWFVILGNDRLGNPLNLPLPSPLLTLDMGRQNIPQGQGHPALTVVDNRAPVVPVPMAPINPAPASTEKPALTAPIAPSSPVETEKPHPAQTPPQPLPPESSKRLVEALLHGDLVGARAVVAVAIPMDAASLTEYRNALSAIPDPLRLAEETLLASKGQEITITYNGKDRKITLRNVVNGEIQADFATGDSIRPVTLKTSKFTPEELLKLLPPQPDSAAGHAALCIALLQAKHKADIAAHVAPCGVLGPLFEAAAASLP